MFTTLKFFVIYFTIPSYTNTSPINADGTTLSIKEIVKKEMGSFENLLNELNLVTPSNTNDQVKGKLLGKLEAVIKRAVKHDQFLKEQGALDAKNDKITYLERRIQRVTIPLAIRNKARKIENKHPEIEGTIPKDILTKLKPFEKPIIQRQYKWMELLKCNDDLYIKKLQADLKIAFSNMKSNTLDAYEKFKLNFCYSIATVVEEVNKNVDQFEFEGMEQDRDLGISDPVINPYIAFFYNSLIAREKKL